jgi:hypothetical protein
MVHLLGLVERYANPSMSGIYISINTIFGGEYPNIPTLRVLMQFMIAIYREQGRTNDVFVTTLIIEQRASYT